MYALKAVPANRSSLVFKRPANAAQFRSASRLFTLPGCPGVLFKEVTCLQEIEDIQGGIAYATPDGLNMMAFIGHNMASPLPPNINQATYPGTTCHWNGVAVGMSYIPAITISGTTTGLKLLAGPFTEQYGHLIAPHPDYITCSDVTLKEQSGASMIALSSSAYQYTHVFAVVARADAGHLIKHVGYPRMIGWMSSLVAFGDMNAGMFGAYQDIVSTCDPRLVGCFNEAYLEMKNEGQFQRKPKLGLVTYWGGSMPRSGGGLETLWPDAPQFGAAICRPRVDINTSNAATKVFNSFVTSSSPTFAFPNAAPHMTLFDPPSVPASIKSGVAAWHRMAAAAEVDGCLYPIDFGNINANGWTELTVPLRKIADSKTALASTVSAGIPADEAALATFKPSISKEENYDPFKKLFYHSQSLITGDYVSTFDDRVKALYLRAESKV